MTALRALRKKNVLSKEGLSLTIGDEEEEIKDEKMKMRDHETLSSELTALMTKLLLK